MSTTIQGPPFSLSDAEYRIEGDEKVRGQAAYAADNRAPRMLYAAFAVSTYAHARIVRIDDAGARNAPGVRAVMTGADIGDRRFGRCLLDWPILARERVRFIGEYVVAVAAETLAQAKAAVALIDIEYAELPPVFAPQEALASGAPVLHESAADFRFLAGKRQPVSHPNIQGEECVGQGDVDEAFSKARHVIEHRFTTPRMHTGYIEPRATIVWIAANNVVHVVSTTKAPYYLREQMAAALDLDEASIVVEPAYIGGDFGGKGLSIDEFICYFLARAAGSPVKAVRTYLEDMRSTTVRHAAEISLRSAISEDGRWTALELTCIFDGGAYAAGKPIPHLVPGLGPKTAYHIPNTRISRRCVYTNTVPGGHLRAPSDVQIFFALESHVDLLAAALGEEPLEFRLRHAVRGDQTDVDGVAYDKPRALEVLEALKASPVYRTPLGPDQGRGIAVSARHIGAGVTSGRFGMHADGTIHAHIGMVEQGAGALTMVQRVIAHELRRPRESIFVHRMSTADAPPEGGAGASKVTHVLGRTAQQAARELLEIARGASALAAGTAAGEVAYSDGVFRVGAHAYSWEEAARLACINGAIERVVAYDSSSGRAHGSPEAANFCGYVVIVTVDRETGSVTVDDVVCVVDVGAVINPVAHRGQIEGGFIWGFSHALMEELVVDRGKIENLSLADYKLATIRDIPPLKVIELAFHDGPGPYGAKAAGEISTAAVPPAIANAVAAAGARVFSLPLTAERVLGAISTRDRQQ